MTHNWHQAAKLWHVISHEVSKINTQIYYGNPVIKRGAIYGTTFFRKVCEYMTEIFRLWLFFCNVLHETRCKFITIQTGYSNQCNSRASYGCCFVCCFHATTTLYVASIIYQYGVNYLLTEDCTYRSWHAFFDLVVTWGNTLQLLGSLCYLDKF